MPGRRIVVGGVGQPWRWTATPSHPGLDLHGLQAFDTPGWAKLAMDFELTADGDGTALSTETRVAGTDATARRAFARYWTVIRGPSALLRRIMLAAVAASAEALRAGDATSRRADGHLHAGTASSCSHRRGREDRR